MLYWAMLGYIGHILLTGLTGLMGLKGILGLEQWQVCLYIYIAMGIGYMALWGFRAKCRTGVDSGYPLDCYDY